MNGEVSKSTSSYGRWLFRHGDYMRFFWRKAEAVEFAALVAALGRVPLIAVTAWGPGPQPTHDRVEVPPGMVGFRACLGGDGTRRTDKWGMVTREEYHTRGNKGYVLRGVEVEWPERAPRTA